MKAYILTIGDEILIGQVTDTNATHMAEAMNVEGYEVVEHLSVADTEEGIRSGLDRALAAADVVLMTGGLGEGKIIVSMPGVPYEMRYLVEHEVVPRLVAGNIDQTRQRSLTILTAGAGESTLAEAIEEVEDALPAHVSLAYLPNLGTVRLRLTIRGTDEAAMQAELQKHKAEIEAIIGEHVYGYGKEDLALAVQRRMQERQLTLATAESCTGGAIAGMIVAHPGSSGHFRGSVVAYANDIKRTLLDVPEELLVQHGAVSQPVVETMAKNARRALKTDYAVATSGVAGPGGGTEEKPVGTIWIAVAGPDGVRSRLLSSGKDRERNITYTVHQALDMLRRRLDE